MDPVDEKPSEVEWRFTEAGERVRVSLRCKKIPLFYILPFDLVVFFIFKKLIKLLPTLLYWEVLYDLILLKLKILR